MSRLEHFWNKVNKTSRFSYILYLQAPKYIVTLSSCNYITRSVTRFGEFSPLWQKFTNIWQIFDSLFLIWQNAEHTSENLWYYWANFHCCKWPNIEKIIQPSGHTDHTKLRISHSVEWTDIKTNIITMTSFVDIKTVKTMLRQFMSSLEII